LEKAQFLGAFEKKIAKKRLLICLSVRMKQLGFHWMDFHEIWFFPRKICRENSGFIRI